MFLINSQIPFLTYSSSTLEPIFLPKLLIYFAEFPYNLYLSTFYAIAYHLGYLLRFRYDFLHTFNYFSFHRNNLITNLTLDFNR